MTRHLADPDVGAVTAYIKEGSHPPNWMTKFIAYEYIAAQAAARRAQNTIGGSPAWPAGRSCTRGRTSKRSVAGSTPRSLAEDTFTTFATQLNGKRVVFDGNAVVWAEEPDTIDGLWKQRLRWARGNVQVTSRFRHLWFRRSKHHGLGGFVFGMSGSACSCCPCPDDHVVGRAHRPVFLDNTIGMARRSAACGSSTPCPTCS